MTSDSAPRTAYVPGVFDMFHVGHLNILRTARATCDRLVAGVVSDARAEAVKGVRPVVPESERLEIVGAIRYVDDVVLEDVDEKLAMWERLRFDIVVKGDDWRGTPKGDKLERDFAGVGVEVCYLPYTVLTSSTILREALGLRMRTGSAEPGR